MKNVLIVSFFLMAAGMASAQSVSVERQTLGSGQPGANGVENATRWDNDIFHAPQYLPGFPTAATLYPRVVDVKCKTSQGRLVCQGYNWLPEMGRGEYLMIRPVMEPEVKPQIEMHIVTKTVPVLVEVPVKKKKE